MRQRDWARNHEAVARGRRLFGTVVLGPVLAASVLAVAVMTVAVMTVAIPATSFAAAPTNLIANSGFEHGLTGWTTPDTRWHVGRSRDAHDGRWSALLSARSSRTVALESGPTPSRQTHAGQRYRVWVWVKTPGGAVDAVLRIREVAGGVLVGGRAEQVRLTDRRWHRIEFEYTARATAGTLDLTVLARLFGVGEALLVDSAWLSVAWAPPVPRAARPTMGWVSRPAAAPATHPINMPERQPPGSLPAGGTLFGTSIYRSPGQTFAAAYRRQVAAFGPLGVDRVFYPGLPSPWPGAAGYSGGPVIVSFKVDPRQVLTGAYDAVLTSWFATAPRGRAIWWAYFHEPEDQIAGGAFTAAQYRAAWQRIADLARSVGNSDLHATLILMCYTLDPASGRSFADYYPGSAFIDTLGFDCYNSAASSGAYLDPAAEFGAAVSVSLSLGKPYGIAEFGSVLAAGDSGAGRAAWLMAAGGYLDAHHARWAAYFDSPVNGEYQLLDAGSVAAWRSVVTTM